MNENIKLLIKSEFENGEGVTELSKKYKISANTINSWKKREKWQKKVAPKGKAPNSKKCTKNKTGASDKEIQIKSDIINDVPKDEVMKKYGISEITYYRKSKSIRQMRLENTEKQAQAIIEEVYADLPVFLKNIAIAKRNMAIKIVKAINENREDKEIASLEKKLNLIMKTEKEIMRTGKMLTTFETLEIEAQLTNESLQFEKIEIERLKLEDEAVKDTAIEFNFKENKKIKKLEDTNEQKD